jgi:hypothetical protein
MILDSQILYRFIIAKLSKEFKKQKHKLGNMRASASSLWYKICTQDFLTNMAAHTNVLMDNMRASASSLWEISKVNFRVETQILVGMSEEI